MFLFVVQKDPQKKTTTTNKHMDHPVGQYHLKYSTSKKSKSEAIAPPDPVCDPVGTVGVTVTTRNM